MADLNIETLIGELTRRYGIRLDSSDPAIAIVVLNRLVLESASEELTESVARRLAQFEASMQKVEQRAGKLLAHEVSVAAACVRAELQNDIDAAGVKAAHFVYMVDQAHKRPVIIRWLAAGLVTAIGLLGLGFCAGMYLHL
jgi:type IV pilus biogenesis protein CpaD/CtpE